MKRFDLRHLGADFGVRMCEIVEAELKNGEIGIFLFEIGDFSSVEKSANLVAQNGWTLMNSLRFNEVDWSIVVKKAPQDSSVESSAESNAKIAESSAESAPHCHTERSEVSQRDSSVASLPQNDKKSAESNAESAESPKASEK
ncbi:NADH-ubiquinone oxidoreductase subunit E family protein [Helicobacter sp. 23-1044]